MREKLHIINKQLIKKEFLNYSNIYSQKDLYILLYTLKQKRLVAQDLTTTTFFRFLQEHLHINTYSVYSDKIKKERYSIDELNNYELCDSFEKNSFFSMTTALNIQGFSSFMDNFIFYSKELTPKHNSYPEDKSLKQHNIDNAYSKPYRKTKNIAEYNNSYFVYLTPKHTSQVGVIKYKDFYLSSINRVLIEMIINIQYFKNYVTIIDCFKPIANKLNIDEIFAILDDFHLLYPYFQLIGFTLEKLGYKREQLSKFKDKTKDLIFYTQKFDLVSVEFKYNKYWKIKEIYQQ